MLRKVVLVADPGIDGAFATALALHDPQLDVLGLAASAGNISAEQATKNVQILIEQIDPPRWPRLGAALPVAYDVEESRLHGPGGLGGVTFPCAQLHHLHSSDKLLVDLVRLHPKDITVVVLGPLTVLARAFDRDPELLSLIQRVVCVGGTWREPGNASAVAEHHFYCDPVSARQVLRSGIPLTLLPLDVTRKLIFSPTDLLELPAPESRACRFLRQIAPHGIRMSSSLYGMEGFYLKDVLGVVAVSLPEVFTIKPVSIDVETRGDLTRGMCVVDLRPEQKNSPNADLATGIDIHPVRDYIRQILEHTA
ncbi:MAG TPA: nucleoside hydrolase [Gemmataceae bacterium]|nr:nucleoside hydrolase [Gemmataceae bacterium]